MSRYFNYSAFWIIMFIHGLCAQGNQFAWAKGFGEVGNDAGNIILTDKAGNIYLGGFFRGNVDFDKGIVPHILKSKGSEDIFINKYDPNGQLIWALGFGGKGPDRCTNAVLDASGDLIVLGNFRDTVEFGQTSTVSSGFNDIFIAKISSDGVLKWVRSLGGTLDENGRSLALQKDGHIIVTGTFQGKIKFENTTIPELIAVKNTDIFILSIQSDGKFEWVKQIGGISEEIVYSLCVNRKDEIVVVGTYNSDLDFDPDSSVYKLLQSGVYPNMFVLDLHLDGSFNWVKQFAGDNNIIPYNVKTDLGDKIVVTGTFRSKVDFDPGAGINELIAPGILGDAFVLKLASNGGLDWVKQLGGPLNEIGLGLFIDPYDNIYTTGCYEDGADFDPGIGSYTLYTDGVPNNNDIYISKLSSKGDFLWANGMQGALEDIGFSICVAPSATVHSTGIFSGSLKVNSGKDSSFIMSNGLTDLFIHTIQQTRTDIKDSERSTSLKIYPNPCKDYIFVECPLINSSQEDCKIMDLSGCVFQSHYSLLTISSDRTFLFISLDEGIPNGEYLLELTQGKEKISRAFVICR